MEWRLKTGLVAVLAFALFAIASGPPAIADDGPAPLRAIFHVDEEDEEVHKRAISNVANFFASTEKSGRAAFVTIVVNADGIDMLRRSRSSVADRLSIMEVEYPNLSVVVCQRSLGWREKRQGSPLDIVDMAQRTDSGVVFIAELQAQGWSYIKP